MLSSRLRSQVLMDGTLSTLGIYLCFSYLARGDSSSTSSSSLSLVALGGAVAAVFAFRLGALCQAGQRLQEQVWGVNGAREHEDAPPPI